MDAYGYPTWQNNYVSFFNVKDNNPFSYNILNEWCKFPTTLFGNEIVLHANMPTERWASVIYKNIKVNNKSKLSFTVSKNLLCDKELNLLIQIQDSKCNIFNANQWFSHYILMENNTHIIKLPVNDMESINIKFQLYMNDDAEDNSYSSLVLGNWNIS